jgi:hypothetical protein
VIAASATRGDHFNLRMQPQTVDNCQRGCSTVSPSLMGMVDHEALDEPTPGRTWYIVKPTMGTVGRAQAAPVTIQPVGVPGEPRPHGKDRSLIAFAVSPSALASSGKRLLERGRIRKWLTAFTPPTAPSSDKCVAVLPNSPNGGR